jgi:large subunit ribosomal protein L29
MNIKEILEMSVDQREEKILELKKELLNLRFQLATGTLENTAEIKQVKKDIARLMTANNQK